MCVSIKHTMIKRKRTTRKKGAGFSDFVNGAKNFLKRTKILSTVGKTLTPFAGSFAPLAQGATQYLDQQGYGRRPKRRLKGCGIAPNVTSSYAQPRF